LKFPHKTAQNAEFGEKFLLMKTFNHHIIGLFPQKGNPAGLADRKSAPQAPAGVY